MTSLKMLIALVVPKLKAYFNIEVSHQMSQLQRCKMSSYAGSRVTSITRPSRLGSSRFNNSNVSFGTAMRPSFSILARKLSLTPNTSKIVKLSFKTSEDSSLFSHCNSLGICKRFCLCSTVLKLTCPVKGKLAAFLILFNTFYAFLRLFNTQPANNLSPETKKQPKTTLTKSGRKKIH